MPFQAIAQSRLYEQVAEQIAAIIARGEFRPGDRLPPERDLAAKLGVSRPTVREAMIALEIAGLVEVRTGSGTFVTEAASRERPRLRLPSDGTPGPVELVAARALIEPAIAEAAAARAGADDIARIDRTVDAMAAAADTATHREADRAFHAAIAACAGNAVVCGIVEDLWSAMFSPMFERMGRLSGLIPNEHASTLAEHATIAAAIRAGDGPAARAAMAAHLGHVERILAGPDREEPREDARRETRRETRQEPS